MKSYFSTAAAALSAMIMAAAMVGCEDSSTDGNNMVDAGLSGNGSTITEEDFPYGSTIIERTKESDENIEIKIAFDKRYFIEDTDDPDYSIIYKIHDFVKTLNTKDSDLLQNLYYPGYLEYYAAANSDLGADEYIEEYLGSVEEVLGEGFEIDYIDVSNCILESDEEEGYFDLCDEALVNVAGEDILSKVTSRRVVEIGGYTTYKQGGGSYMLTNHSNAINLYVYVIDGQAYIL